MMHWILVRGWAREARHWGDFPATLAGAIAQARVHAIDLPGAGERRAQACPTSMDAVVESLRTLAPRGERVHLLGLSLGAMACAHWAARHPEEVGALVMINASLRPFSAPWERLRPARIPRILGAACTRDEIARERAILALTSNCPSAHMAVAQRWAAWARERPMSRATVARQLWLAATYRAPRIAPGVPILVLRGEGDRLVDPACSEAIARAWHATLASHPTAGHDLTMDDGPWVAAQVRRRFTPT